MNRLVFFCAIVLLLVVLTSCRDTQIEITDPIKITASTTIENLPTDSYGTEMYYGFMKHKTIYYTLPASVFELVGYEVFEQWADEIGWPFDDFHEMAVIQFIKRFDVSRQQFDEANVNYEEFMMNEGLSYDEIDHFNPDILYTFNNEIIDAYLPPRKPHCAGLVGNRAG